MKEERMTTAGEWIPFTSEDVRPAALGGGDGKAGPWRILIVDDEIEVHRATEFAASGITVSGRPLVFLHAANRTEALQVLRATEDIALILLDVVMETPDAGLRLVKDIRETLGMHEVRIVLHTGQPGYAPELEVIRDYDINDYKQKNELTRTRLITTLISALRAYEQLRTVSSQRRGLDMIVKSSPDLFSRRALKTFSAGVLAQLSALLEQDADGLVCAHGFTSTQTNNARTASGEGATADDMIVIAAAGKDVQHIDCPLSELADADIKRGVVRCFDSHTHIFEPQAVFLYLNGSPEREIVVALRTPEANKEEIRPLLEVFAVNACVGFENVALFEKLQDYAYTDQLTRIPNRVRFIHMLDEAFRSGGGAQAGCTAALIHIERFTEVNDALGHSTGDLLLVSVAERLRAALPPEVQIARVGAGLYGVFGTEALVQPETLLAIFQAPFAIKEYSLPVTVHVGLNRMSGDQASGITAFKNTSIALNHAQKDARRRYHYFAPELETRTQASLDLLSRLRGAIDRNQLEVFYQPQVTLNDRRVVGVEGLIRWRMTDGTNIPPMEFIPLAERSGLILEIGQWMLRSVCSQALEWQRQGLWNLRASINISAAEFHNQDFVPNIRRILAETGVDPHCIELEITESVAMQDVDLVIEVLNELKETGLGIAIDDFGTGFSSLSYLQRFPIDRLKIDQSFVFAMTATSEGLSIPRMIIDLAHNLGHQIIAEGVESKEHADILAAMGCEEGQGYYFSRPMDVVSFSAWYQAQLKQKSGDAPVLQQR